MASLKKAAKSAARLHRERGQLIGRPGFLENKKDYQLRARDAQKKKDAIKVLEKKAEERNPDEFYFKMVNTVKKDGIHQDRETEEPTHTDEQIKLMRSQDIRYVNYKRTIELKKIEKLKAELHMLDAENKPKNKHTIFVDTKKQVKEFDAAKHFNTHPSLLKRTYNRPTLETLAKCDMSKFSAETLQGINRAQSKRYKELEKRIKREKELRLIAAKMTMHNAIMDKQVKSEKIAPETTTRAAQYKWASVRKR